MRSIGGTGRAPLFPWGLAYNPVSERYIVTDYFNYQVRQYGADWSYQGVLPQPVGADGDPESVLASVAVDPVNGDVYVAKPKPDTLAHYDAAGNRLPDVVVDPGSGAQTYTAWLATDDAGYLYVLDSHLWNTDDDPSRLIKLAPGGGTQVAAWDLRFPGQLPTQAYGIDVSAAGRIYISDSINRRIQILAPDGSYLGSLGSAGGSEVVGGLSGDLRGVLVDDANQRIYVADALQNQVEVFALDATPLFHLGGEGSDPGQLIAPRQMTFGPDGRLWVSEYGNYRVQAFDPDTGASLAVRPQPLPERPVGQLGQPRDIAVDASTGNVWVADTWNQRFQEFAPDGSLLGSWGGRGNLPPYGLKYPRGIGFDPVNRRVWVTNNAAGTIYVYDDQGAFLFQLGSEDNRSNSEPGFFEKPFGVTFGNGYAYVTDIGTTYAGNTVKVKILDALTGTEIGTIARNAKSLDVDEATGEVYVADAGVNQQKIFVYGPTGGTALRSFGGKGTADGKFTGLWGVTVANGIVYATDEARSRIQAFSTTGTFLGKWGGFGIGPYQFRNPSGISHDAAGRVYVADAANDRIVVFDPSTPKPAYQFSRPGVAIAAPADGSFVDAPVTIAGTATDNRGLATIEVSVRDEASGLWWDPATATWVATQTWGFAPWRGTPINAAWSWTFPGPQYERVYHVEVRARDIDNTLSSPVRSAGFTVHRFVPDAVPPESTIDAPSDGDTLSLAPVLVSGTAADDQGLAEVGVAVRHVPTGQWWTGSAWSSTETWLSATLAVPGSTASSWSWTFTPPAAGNYLFLAAARDLATNVDPSAATANVTVNLGGPDTQLPDGTITSVFNNEVLPLAPVAFNGTATDDAGVTGVDVAIRNRDTLKWWNATTGLWVDAFTWNSGVALGTPGASPTTWSYGWTPPAAARYAVTVRARDAAGNVDATRPWINFVVA